MEQSGDMLEDITGAVKRLAETVTEIATATEQQSSGIAQVNAAVAQIDDTTQQNVAMVEAASSATTAMNEQTDSLRELVGLFKTVSDAEVGAETVRPGEPEAPEERDAEKRVSRTAALLGSRGAVALERSEWQEF